MNFAPADPSLLATASADVLSLRKRGMGPDGTPVYRLEQSFEFPGLTCFEFSPAEKRSHLVAVGTASGVTHIVSLGDQQSRV